MSAVGAPNDQGAHVTPLENLARVAKDPASTIGQIVDAVAQCAALPDFPCDSFRPILSPRGWDARLRDVALRACATYDARHADGEAQRAFAARERAHRERLAAFWTDRGVDPRDVPAALELAGVTRPEGIECRLWTRCGGGYTTTTLDKCAPAVKPVHYCKGVTVGGLRRLVALSIVEHRDHRLYFMPDLLVELREAGFIDADGKAVKP